MEVILKGFAVVILAALRAICVDEENHVVVGYFGQWLLVTSRRGKEMGSFSLTSSGTSKRSQRHTHTHTLKVEAPQTST